jgi:hypothetical protein
MRMNFKPYVWVLAVVVAAGIIGSTVRTVASPAMNAAGQDTDYSKNRKYQQGIREGKDDKAHKDSASGFRSHGNVLEDVVRCGADMNKSCRRFFCGRQRG